MPHPRHSAGSDHCLVHCCVCGEPMRAIYDPSIRDTCAECGGAALTAAPDQTRAEIRREYLAKIRNARRA